LNKIIFILLLLVNSLLANLSTQNDISTLKDLGLEPSFSSESSFQNIFQEYSSGSKISYYDNFLKKSSLNVQIVRSEIEKENLPEAVFFIPLIESSFVNQTRGKSSPGGLWQIIPQTASSLKLRNDEFVDERLDLIKSTDAASSYIKGYYKKLGKWYLAILAYNCGEGRVLEGIARASLDRYLELNPHKSDDSRIKSYKIFISDYQKTKKGFSNLYEVYNEIGKAEGSYSFEYLIKNNKQKDYIPATSLNYVQKLIALSIISNRNLFKNIDKKSKYELQKVKAPSGLQLKSIANAISMNFEELKSINKHIKKQVVPSDSKNYNIYIPNTKLDVYNQKMGNITVVKDNINVSKEVETKKNNKINKEKPLIYIIKKGDSLESIAKKHKVSIKKLKIVNNKKSNLLKIGDKIEIYK
jgi:membrane-bound lytic murein transglycosylase D